MHRYTDFACDRRDFTLPGKQSMVVEGARLLNEGCK